MTRNVAVVTDSAAMLPAGLVERYGVFIAPLNIILNGREYLDGVDLDADTLYAALQSAPSVSTSQPSPGRLLECYQRAADAGAGEVVSIHIGSGISGTITSAQAAAALSPIPVTIVDTGQASFAEGLCALEALDVLEAGGSAADAADAARAAGARVGNTFIVKALDLARRGGRLRDAGDAVNVPVLALKPDGMQVVGNASTLDDAVALMAAHVRTAADAAGRQQQALRVGIANGGAPKIAASLRAQVATMPNVAEIIDYIVGPSMGAHLGPGNAGAVFIARPTANR